MSRLGERGAVEVTLNRDRLNQAIAPEERRVSGEFDVVLRNEGEPAHVHLRFGGPLARAAAVGTSNHYVDAGATRRVEVAVAPIESPVEGTLEVVTGHGVEGTEIALTLDPPPAPVDVDESLASPPGARSKATATGSPTGTGDADASSGPPAEGPGGSDGVSADRDGDGERSPVSRLRRALADAAGGTPDAATAAVGALAFAALVGAASLGAAFDSAAVSLGVVAVVVAVAAALYLLFAP